MTEQRPVTHLAFSDSAMPQIAAELGVAIVPAPFRLRGAPVWETRIPTRWLPSGALRVQLWPSIARIDIRVVRDGGGATPIAFTARAITQIEIYHGVEVMFRRDGGRVLFITKHGHAAIAD